MFDLFTSAPGKIAILEQKISGALGISINLAELSIAGLVLFAIHIIFRTSLFETSVMRKHQ